MTQRIGRQARQLWQALSSPQTGQTYQAAAATTWTLLRETGLLLWLLACLVLVAFDWGINAALAAGRGTRGAVSQLGNIQTETLATDTKQALLTAGKTGLTNTLSQARSQLGIESTPALAQPTAEPVTEAAAEPVTKTAAEPVTEAAAEPVTKAPAEPVTEPAAKATAEPTAAPRATPEAIPEAASDPVTEAAPQTQVTPATTATATATEASEA